MLAVLTASTFGQDNLPQPASTKSEAPLHEQIKSEVGALFNSPLSKDQAWAAYLSGKYGLREYIPPIFELLQRSSANLQDQNRLICLIAFDSLIQLDATIAATELMPLYKTFPDEVTILLARRPKENQEALLAIARQINPQEANRQYWLAACNLLAATEAKGFAAHLLEEMTIALDVNVTDRTGVGMGGGIGTGCAACGFGSYPVPDDFPPIAIYALVDKAEPGVVVVAPGEHPIYYGRTVVDAKMREGVPAGRSRYCWRKKDYVLEYLAALLKTDVGGLQFTDKPSRHIEWRNGSHYKAMVSIFRSEIEGGYAELKSRLLERGVLSTSESELLRPRITVRVFDSRGDQRGQAAGPTGRNQRVEE
jgi:hypothetical protein